MKMIIEAAPKAVTIEEVFRIEGKLELEDADRQARISSASDYYVEALIIEGDGTIESASVCTGNFGDFFVETFAAELGTITVRVRLVEHPEVFTDHTVECVANDAEKAAAEGPKKPKSIPPSKLAELPPANGTVATSAPLLMPDPGVRSVPPPPAALNELDPLGMRPIAARKTVRVSQPPMDPESVAQDLEFVRTSKGISEDKRSSIIDEIQRSSLVPEMKPIAAAAPTPPPAPTPDEPTIDIVVEDDAPAQESETVEALNAAFGNETSPPPAPEPEPTLDLLSARASMHSQVVPPPPPRPAEDDLTSLAGASIPFHHFTAEAAEEEEVPTVARSPHRTTPWVPVTAAAAALLLVIFGGVLASSKTPTVASPAPTASTQTTASVATCNVRAIVTTEDGYDFDCR